MLSQLLRKNGCVGFDHEPVGAIHLSRLGERIWAGYLILRRLPSQKCCSFMTLRTSLRCYSILCAVILKLQADVATLQVIGHSFIVETQTFAAWRAARGNLRSSSLLFDPNQEDAAAALSIKEPRGPPLSRGIPNADLNGGWNNVDAIRVEIPNVLTFTRYTDQVQGHSGCLPNNMEIYPAISSVARSLHQDGLGEKAIALIFISARQADYCTFITRYSVPVPTR